MHKGLRTYVCICMYVRIPPKGIYRGWKYIDGCVGVWVGWFGTYLLYVLCTLTFSTLLYFNLLHPPMYACLQWDQKGKGGRIDGRL